MRIRFEPRKYRFVKGSFTLDALVGPSAHSTGVFHPLRDNEGPDLDMGVGQTVHIDLWNLEAARLADGTPVRIYRIQCGCIEIGPDNCIEGWLRVPVDDSGMLVVKTVDIEGNPDPNRRVLLMDVDHVATHETSSGPDGEVAFAGLNPGTYVAEIVECPSSSRTFLLTGDREEREIVLREEP